MYCMFFILGSLSFLHITYFQRYLAYERPNFAREGLANYVFSGALPHKATHISHMLCRGKGSTKGSVSLSYTHNVLIYCLFVFLFHMVNELTRYVTRALRLLAMKKLSDHSLLRSVHY